MISQKLLLDLRTIIQEDYGQKLEMSEVTDIAMTLVGFAETLMKVEAVANNSAGGQEKTAS